jgi:hypothetical protein
LEGDDERFGQLRLHDLQAVLTREECRSLAAMYERDDIFRSTVVMLAMVSVEARTNTGPIHCQKSLLTCEPLCTRRSLQWPIGGTSR